MQYRTTTLAAALASTTLAAYVPSEPWSTLTPSGIYSNGLTDYTTAFGIAVVPITTAVATVSAHAKRDVAPISQIGDGQIQATTSTAAPAPTKAPVAPISQIGDGQIQATTQTTAPVAPISQIGDGQIQATTKTVAPVAPISQIGDGQIQATTTTRTTTTLCPTTAPVAPISQIGDGQIQATTKTVAPVAPISQIGDGQIQATTATTKDAISQIGDGQIQATTATSTKPAVSQITDGQIQATSSSAPAPAPSNNPTSPANPVKDVSCKSDSTLSMTLQGSQLIDSKGRIGSIVANRQFQFDGPPPQAGAIYAAGWSVTPEGNLAIGTNDVFYQCLSGNFYNLYDESIGAQCSPVHLQAIDLISC